MGWAWLFVAGGLAFCARRRASNDARLRVERGRGFFFLMNKIRRCLVSVRKFNIFGVLHAKSSLFIKFGVRVEALASAFRCLGGLRRIVSCET